MSPSDKDPVPFMQFPNAAGQSYQALQTNLSEAASSLNLASSKVVTSVKREPDEQAASASSFVGCYKELLTAGLMLAGVAKARTCTYTVTALATVLAVWGVGRDRGWG